MDKLQVYQLMHLISVMLLIGTTFAAFAKPDPAVRRKCLMVSGILSVLVLVGGMGLLAVTKLASEGMPGWIVVKMVCWLVISALAGIVFRKPKAVVTLRVVTILAIVTAVAMVYLRPF